MKVFNDAKASVTSKEYDYLDQRNDEFDEDFEFFIGKTNELKQKIGTTIEDNFQSVWESPQGICFLTRFEKVIISLSFNELSISVSQIFVFFKENPVGNCWLLFLQIN